MIKKLFKKHEFVLFITIILLSIFFQSLNTSFLTLGNIFSMIDSMIVTGIFAVGVFLIIVSGDIDVSHTAIAPFAMYVTTKLFLYFELETPIIFVFLLAGFIGSLLGIFNAYFVHEFKLPTLIVTLGTHNLFRGFLLAFIGTKIFNSLPLNMVNFSKSSLFTVKNQYGWTYHLPSSLLILLIVIFITYIIIKYTRLGRGIFAIGSNREAAKRIGFDIRKIQYFIYGYLGFLSGIGGMIYGMKIQRVDPFSISGMELSVIAAVVLGGTKITGGKGTLTGTILGVILLTIIKENLILINIPSYWQNIVIGLLIITSIAITTYREKFKN